MAIVAVVIVSSVENGPQDDSCEHITNLDGKSDAKRECGKCCIDNGFYENYFYGFNSKGQCNCLEFYGPQFGRD